MIVTQLLDTNPFVIGEGLATKLEAESLKEITEVAANDICLCDWGCEYIETVFADASGVWWKNDKNTFLFQKITVIDTITIKLFKNGIELATITNDTYGEYTNGFTAQPLYIEFIVHWKKVFDIEGPALYQIKVDQTLAGSDQPTFESRKFRLLPYSDLLANKTVRVETYQTGNIVGSEFDYTDLHFDGFYQSFRVNGIFGNKTPKLEIDNYLEQDYTVAQIRPKVITEWTLEARMIPAVVADMLTQDNVIANTIEITDYNFRNNAIYREVDLVASEISDVQHFANNPLSNYFITFTNKKDNVLKSNV